MIRKNAEKVVPGTTLIGVTERSLGRMDNGKWYESGRKNVDAITVTVKELHGKVRADKNFGWVLEFTDTQDRRWRVTSTHKGVSIKQ